MDSLDSQVRHVERVNLARGLVRMRVGRHDPTSPASQIGSLHVRRQLSLPFIPAVLKPNFDLRVKEFRFLILKKMVDISCDD